jgi:hypothetical protein
VIFIRAPSDLNRISDQQLRRLLLLRMAQLADGDVFDPDRHGELHVVEPGDVAEDVEYGVNFPILSNVVDGTRWGETDYSPCCDFIHEHPTSFELVFSVSDIGFALFVPRAPGVDSALLSLCAAFAVPAAG